MLKIVLTERIFSNGNLPPLHEHCAAIYGEFLKLWKALILWRILNVVPRNSQLNRSLCERHNIASGSTKYAENLLTS
jgi:hypothetical protein